ncbi:hypothetical protein [Leuconostoc pseudomesenteroides]|uniref:hypothetical protein n=1 Tax=Leuconostoc pseudomesenteroides TaxID=33968 RepID=UPI001667019B|nr:hypothetical protein [Leuconostoc pseudomesenteroides]
MSKNEDLQLTHEGYLLNSVKTLHNNVMLLRDLSHGRNKFLNGVLDELQASTGHAMSELKKRPTHLTASQIKADIENGLR